MTALIDIIAGVRPNFMKIAPIIHALERRRAVNDLLRFRLVHTGQHYDSRMSRLAPVWATGPCRKTSTGS
jgi:UDP-N-acetylglucosamine 2-epimerase (non-hydrolysing)